MFMEERFFLFTDQGLGPATVSMGMFFHATARFSGHGNAGEFKSPENTKNNQQRKILL
jgi:hypothetical protein